MLKPLTSFRFIAALLVFQWHSDGISTSVFNKYQLGYAGVSFFFLLSGFILTYKYLPLIRRYGRLNKSAFYSARFAKIYPVHLLTFLAAIPLVVIWIQQGVGSSGTSHIAKTAMANLFLFQSFLPSNSTHFSFNTVTWSISDEMFFYLLFPLVIGGLLVIGNRLRTREIIAAVAVLWMLFATLALYLAPRGTSAEFLLYVLPPMRLLDFVVGSVLGLLFLDRRAPTLTKHWYTVMEIGAVALLVAAIGFSPHIPQTLRYSIFLMPFWSLMIWVFASQVGTISSLFSARWLVFLGEVSFSFYMIHWLVIQYLILAPLSNILTYVLSLVVSLVLSIVLFQLYENPMRRRLRGRTEAAIARLGQRTKPKAPALP